MTGRVSKAPTLTVVARGAGVSVPTVSKVLRGRTDVAAETRERVMRVLDELGYPRRRSPADRVRVGAALVDVVLHELDTAWSSALVNAIEAEAQCRELGIVVSALSRHTPRTTPSRQWLDGIAARGSCGVLGVQVDFTDAQVRYLREHEIPHVVIDPYHEPGATIPTVRVRNRDAERAATQHLIDLGHRRIAMVAGKPRSLSSQQRLAGYQAALTVAGFPVDAELLQYGDFRLSGGRQAMHELLTLPVPPTAVVFASDKMALGGYLAAADLGVRIPHDVSVVGYDDTFEAAVARPALTSVRQPFEAMASAGFDVLTTVPSQPSVIECDARLVVRASTGHCLRQGTLTVV
ncbi:LacI family DNA-binding transcriptional regulator [Phytoactinopolyspora endophytica]|uniref:LacI family DNA-binding transcriptional regulator n=1 Tax=Phytoactinopolyspora endophytica TaxID=1642495 RepID=UPI00101C085B|nr:LacI family DNA-binding transcriptional regulator [Phytoactinopolyspora endophytica]